MENEQIEKLLTDLGVTELMEQKVKDAGIVEQTEPIVQTNTEVPVVEETKPEIPAVQPEKPAEVAPEKVEPPIEEDIWKDIAIVKEEPKEIDYKAELEKTQNEFKSLKDKIEKHKPIKDLTELIDSPDFDLEKFFEVNSKKSIDFTQYPVENLYKQKLANDQIAGYTPEEIDELWEDKKAELAANPKLEKSLKSELVREFQANQPTVSNEEPEIIKTWKQANQERVEQMEKSRADQLEITKGIKDFSSSLVGKKIAGEIEITQADSDAVSDKMTADYYKGKDGKLDTTKITLDRLKAVKFDEMVNYFKTQYKKDAVIEARQEITKPSKNENGGGGVVNVDTRDPATQVIENAMASMGLPTDLVLKK